MSKAPVSIDKRTPKAIAIGARIRTRREQKSFTQAALASKVGVTENAITQYETGRALPRHVRLEKIASELETTVDWLLTGGDPDERIRAQTRAEMDVLELVRAMSAEQQTTAVAVLRALTESGRKK